MNETGFKFRLASPLDALAITLLYHKVYQGRYSDPVMREVSLLTGFLASDHSVWVIGERDREIVCSVVYEIDVENKLAKTFGGAVLSECRGYGLLEKAMVYGYEMLTQNIARPIEVIYATTRTTTKAAQIVTDKLGYRKLGIFPNVHRTDSYETHCLVARFEESAIEKRFSAFKSHPKVASLYKIVQKECALPELEIASVNEVQAAIPQLSSELLTLEILDAPKFTTHRFRQVKVTGAFPCSFYPFHEPNLLISSPCERVQIFLHMAPLDKYCTIIALKKPDNFDTKKLLNIASSLLREKGVRYIEAIIRADKLATLEHVINAGFTPCAYFPAFQVEGNRRYDFVVLSQTFENLNFSGIQLAGLNKEYLLHYFERWKEGVLDSALEG